MSASQRIYERFLDGTLANKNVTEICKILSIPYRERNRLIPLLDALCKEGELYCTQTGKYGTAEQLGLIRGVISGNERGFGFLIPEDKTTYPNDFFLSKKHLNGALHGDVVLAQPLHRQQSVGERTEAEVLQILKRGYDTIVGTFRRDRRCGYLIPDEKKYSKDIYIPLKDCFNIPNGVKAVAKITEYPHGRAPGGYIQEILGEEDDFFAEELSIIRSYNLREEFPIHVEKEAEKQERRGITLTDLKGRTDFRDKLIVTVDGEDTRDIDDAISLEMDGDCFVLGVHIADVSHYVLPRTPLDEEALERGTSVYFPDSVLPMLPRALSNGICSLNENEDRLTLSCIMRISPKGVVRGSEIVEGVIRSSKKLTYTQVEKVLNGNEETINALSPFVEMINRFATLTRILQEKRQSKGSIQLDVKEAKILFNKETNEISIPDYERKFSYQIIEAFMVLANETVAEYMHSIEAPFIYRIHEKPSEEKATLFRAFAQTLGLSARFQADDVKPYDYQNLLNVAKDLPAYSVLNRVMLRSMQKARYSPENVGHFGLASTCYCHFTSPIRRYPDLCIHRIVKEVINGHYETALEKYGNFVEHAAEQSSARERRATEAERDVDDLYKTMYMSDKIGEYFEAVISGVTSFGLFAELPNTIEGFIPIETLYGTYTFDPDHFKLVGTDKTYTIGESINVKVVAVDFERRRTEFRIVKDNIKERI